MIVIKINWKARLKNKAFIISFFTLIVSFAYQVMNLMGILPAFSEKELFDVISIMVDIFGLLGIIVDPTTKGISDSERALTYYKTGDILKGEE